MAHLLKGASQEVIDKNINIGRSQEANFKEKENSIFEETKDLDKKGRKRLLRLKNLRMENIMIRVMSTI